MKIYIGPYVNWVGPFQIADLLMKFGVSEDRCYEIGEWLSELPLLNGLCQWIHDRRKRKIKIQVHKYDTWNMDSTLAMIILPMLKQLQATKHGSPSVDDEDVPEHLRSTSAPPKENDWDTDALWHDRWVWVLDELIWTFEQLQPDYDWQAQYESGEIDIDWIDDGKETAGGLKQLVRGPRDTYKIDREAVNAHSARISKGLQLFGKYYQRLWD